MPFTRIGIRERLAGRPIVAEIPDPPTIPGWRLVDPTDINEASGDVMAVVITRPTPSRWSRTLRLEPVGDAWYVRDSEGARRV